MAKYLLLKHYRGAPAPANDVPMDRWAPDEVEAHIRYMNDFAAKLEASGEFVDGQALAPEGMWVRSDGEGRPAVTDGPFAETKEQLGSYFLIEARDLKEAIDVASKHPAARLNEHLGWGVEIRPIEMCRVGVAAERVGRDQGAV